MIRVNIQFQTNAGGPTTGALQEFPAVPRIGETILTGNGEFVVSDVQWRPDGQPTAIAKPK
jgi:hypothetical protein